MNADKIRAKYLKNGVPVRSREDIPEKGYCMVCGGAIIHHCRCPDPDFCTVCFDLYKEGILASTGHSNKKGVPLEELID
jgi:hypothetical protein